MAEILDGVIAYVYARSCGHTNLQAAVVAKLKDLGARVSTRLSKEVTHVIFQRQHHPSIDQKAAEDVELRSVYEKASKVSSLAVVCKLTVVNKHH